jgi:hypothetical protein
VRSSLLFLVLFRSLSSFWWEEDEGVWTSTPADRVGSRPRVEFPRSGSGSGGIHIRMWDEWDVDPTGASPLVGGPERVACGESVA